MNVKRPQKHSVLSPCALVHLKTYTDKIGAWFADTGYNVLQTAPIAQFPVLPGAVKWGMVSHFLAAF